MPVAPPPSSNASNALTVQLENAHKAMEAATTIPEAGALQSQAAGIERYARRHNLSKDTIALAFQVKIESLAHLGKLIQP